MMTLGKYIIPTEIIKLVRVGIVVFPGSNCDRDVHHTLQYAGHDPTYIWHEDHIPKHVDSIILPGGFSFADRLRAGVIASHSPIISDIQEMAKEHKPILGICNGFQILAEAGLLPGVLLPNGKQGFMCKWTNIITHQNKTPFTRTLDRGTRIPIPVANGEGRYYVDDPKKLERNGQIVFKYEYNINGSTDNIAGVCNEDGNVVGLMPHPERGAEPDINPYDHRPAMAIFEGMVA